MATDVWGTPEGSPNAFTAGFTWSVSGTTLTVVYKVKCTSNTADTQTYTLTGAITGTGTYSMNTGTSGGTHTIVTKTRTVTPGSSYTIGMALSGIYSGVTPSVSKSITIPASGGPPDAPGGTSASVNSAGEGTLRWDTAGTNGVPISNYQVQIATNSAFTAGEATASAGLSARSYTFEARPPDVYYCRVRALTASTAPGPWSTTRSFTVAATGSTVVHPLIGGTWRDAVVDRVFVNGTWRTATEVHALINGVWRRSV